jgi:hypothetical protein
MNIKMTNEELVSTLTKAAASIDGNIALRILIQMAAERITELDDRCEELGSDKDRWFRMYEALCNRIADKKHNYTDLVSDGGMDPRN